jgi:hypothetical protein
MVLLSHGMRRRALAAIAAALLASPAAAASGLPALGLDALHWNTSRAEAAQAFAPLRHPLPDPANAKPPPAGETRVHVGGYDWQGCHFGGPVYFDKQGLAALTLSDFDPSDACVATVYRSLTAQFGEGRSNFAHGARSYVWQRADCDVRYVWMSGLGLYVWLSRHRDETVAP